MAWARSFRPLEVTVGAGMFDFEGKVALVTGGSRGIGRATVELLGRGGATVIVSYIVNEAAAEEVVEAVKRVGGNAGALRFDVADPQACKRAVEQVVKECGSLDVLVNNAGIAMDGIVMRLKSDDWDRSLAVNLSGVFHMCRAASRSMMKQRSGAIVNVSSVVARSGNSGQAAYAAAKGGVVSLTRSMARELAGRGIRVNAVSPGLIDTDMTAAIPEEVRSRVIDKIPLGRIGVADEVAGAIAFLASDQASYVTGHVLDVNGGMYMS